MEASIISTCTYGWKNEIKYNNENLREEIEADLKNLYACDEHWNLKKPNESWFEFKKRHNITTIKK